MKSKKIVASLMALSIIGSSGAIFNSVQASEVNKVTKHQSISMTQNVSDSYSIYCTLDKDACISIYTAYLSGTTSSKGLADYIVAKGYATTTVANTISRIIVLYGISAFTAQVSDYGVSFLKSPIDYENKYTIVPRNPSVSYYNYRRYISRSNIQKVINYLNTQSKPYSKTNLSTFLLDNGIWSSQGTVYAVAEALCYSGPDCLKRINDDGIYILQSNRNEYVAAPELVQI